MVGRTLNYDGHYYIWGFRRHENLVKQKHSFIKQNPNSSRRSEPRIKTDSLFIVKTAPVSVPVPVNYLYITGRMWDKSIYENILGNLADYVFIIWVIPDNFNKSLVIPNCVFSCYSQRNWPVWVFKTNSIIFVFNRH